MRTRKDISVNVGDVIMAELPHRNKTVSGEVIEVQKRFGTGIDGKRTPPLLIIKAVGIVWGGELLLKEGWRFVDGIYKRGLCQSLVTKILVKGNLPKVKENKVRRDRGLNICKTSRKGILCGPLSEIIRMYLSELDEEIVTAINGKKAKRLYLKHPMGLISRDEYGFFLVRKKYFKRWFDKNWRKCLHTYAEMDAMQNEFDKKYEEDYWKLVEEEMERDMMKGLEL